MKTLLQHLGYQQPHIDIPSVVREVACVNSCTTVFALGNFVGLAQYSLSEAYPNHLSQKLVGVELR
jgi:hypothetical protein